jgi:DNA-binding winged helix-turn-helix (wHTH) protein
MSGIGSAMRLRFGDCVLDSDTREVLRRGVAVPMPPKVFQLLEELIAERPKALSKTVLHERLWPDTFVSDANLVNLVADLREALGDDAKNPRIIRTVQRFGYAFQAEAVAEKETARAPESVFRLIWGDREVTLREGSNILGRDRDALLWVEVYSVSRHHARITVRGDEATVEDLGSKNGTFVGARRILTPTAVEDGDEIRIGTVTMTLRRFTGVSTQTARVQ